MDENLIILLEWFRANGIHDVFNPSFDNLCEKKQSEEIINIKKFPTNFETSINLLAQKQKSILPNDYFDEIRNICDTLQNIEDVKNIVNNF